MESARSLEGIAFNRARSATLFTLSHFLHFSSLLLLLLVGVVEKPPSFIEAGGLHLVAPNLLATISLVLDGAQVRPSGTHQVKADRVKSGQVRSGQVKSSQVRSVRSGHVT